MACQSEFFLGEGEFLLSKKLTVDHITHVVSNPNNSKKKLTVAAVFFLNTPWQQFRNKNCDRQSISTYI